MNRLKFTAISLPLGVAIVATIVMVRSQQAGSDQSGRSSNDRSSSQDTPRPTERAGVSSDKFTDAQINRPARPTEHVDVSPADPVQIQAVDEWTKMFFANEETGVIAERYRFVDIDWFTLNKAIQSSLAYLAAASARVSDKTDHGDRQDFEIKLFDDLQLAFNIDEADIKLSGGLERILIRGRVDSSENSSFRFTIRSNPHRITGRIDTPDHYIRIETPKDAQVTVIAEFDRDRLEPQMKPID